MIVLFSVASLSLAAVIPASTLVRIPSEDSAVIQSHRLGGNFAYSAHEAHAYGVNTPIVEQRIVPQGITYHHGVPQVRTHTTVHKQSVPQFGVVRTQHTVPSVQYVQTPGVVQYSGFAHQNVQTPVVSAVSGFSPVQYRSPVQILSHQPTQYISGVSSLFVSGVAAAKELEATPVEAAPAEAAAVEAV